MSGIFVHMVFSLKIYILATIISITIMEIVVLIGRFIRLGKG
jgi:hypothetical protein